MNAEEQLAHESRVRTRQTILAAAAGILLVAAAAVQLAGPHTKVDELTLDLIVANQRFPLDLIASIINAIASLAIAATLIYLWGCARGRNPQTAPWIKWVALAGGLLAAVSGVAYAIVVAIKVHQFVTSGSQTYAEANHLTSGAGLIILQLLGQAAALLLAVAFVMVSLSAMRVGLLSRFMGYLGMFAGALVLFQITQIPVVQGYWLAALAYMFSGRWPTGLPPAWRTGQAEPWPSQAEVRARRAAGAGAGDGATGGGARGFGGLFGRGQPQAAPQPTPEPQPAGAPASARTRSGTPKRKRKRRG
jgi:hypothetical protein